MKKLVFLLTFSAICLINQSQTLPMPSVWFGSRLNSTALHGTDSLGQAAELQIQGGSPIASDLINGYPAVKFDTMGYFKFQTPQLLDKNNALFFIIYEAQNPEKETGLWCLKNDSTRKKFLTSFNVGDGKSKVRYKYFFEKGANVTTNFVHFENRADSVALSPVDTIFLGKVEVIGKDSLKTIKNIFFNGKLAEFLIITDNFTEVERQVWQSYFAIKYGVTMYKGNYLNSAGDTLWYYSQNQDFSNGVGGIGRDDVLGLKQNFSTIAGDSVKISLHNANTQLQPVVETYNYTSLQNGEYIFWGHNEQEATLGSAIFPVGNDFYYLFNRIWKIRPYVQNQYLLDLQINIPTNFNNPKMFISNTSEFLSWQTQILTPTSTENGKIKFSNLNFTDSTTYFTFGYTQSDVDNSVFNNENSNTQNGSQNPINQVFTEATYLPNPVVENLYIDYKLTRPATIWFSVQGNGAIPLCQTPPANKPAGDNQTIIPMGHLPTGTYAMYIHVDDMALMQVIIKR